MVDTLTLQHTGVNYDLITQECAAVNLLLGLFFVCFFKMEAAAFLPYS